MQKLYDKVDKETSIENMEMLVFRPVFAENSSVTFNDMMGCSLEMAMKINEYLDIRDTIEEQQQKEAEQEQQAAAKRK